MRSHSPFVALCLSTLLALSPAFVSAADIDWGNASQITGNSDVSTSGNLVGAVNIGGQNVPSTTVNGVNFQSLPAPMGSGAVGNFSLVSSGGSFGDDSSSGSPAAPFSALSPEYQSLLSSRVAGVFGTLDVVISGLVAGALYEIQFWVNNSSSEEGFDTTFAGGMNRVTLLGNTSSMVGGLGQFVIGSFTADATTQNIGISWGEVGFVNAFQLRQIPVASSTVPENGGTIGLLAFSASGLAFISRRLRQASATRSMR